MVVIKDLIFSSAVHVFFVIHALVLVVDLNPIVGSY
jgi:hypothetical protein